MKKRNAYLQIRQVSLSVNLGWRSKERAEEQGVLLDIDIDFDGAPAACESDDLKNTVCYDKLINTIRTQLGDKHFRLVEHLAHDIYNIVIAQLPGNATAIVHLSKFPRVEGLSGGVCFSYGDL